ncbi:cupredoxin domain-containing protein [Cohnella mopanensis]|uniref:cupredoxin domain-containing protein n=1 Tax=Cohnella mopanensis TaxID=2911966 RepID=UPI001EF80F06|nr:cupredoxin family copper-binding protein [Cohnella mopanensis]
MNLRHKSYLTVFTVLILAFALTACGSSNKEGSDASVEASASADVSESASSSIDTSSSSPSVSVEQGEEPSETKESTSGSPTPSAAASSSESHVHESAAPSETPSESSSEQPVRESENSEMEIVIEIKDFAFTPAEITIPKGSTVTFINRDKVKHTATADEGEFDTGLFGKDVSKEVKFDDAGTFAYYCAPHPGMTGTITVEDK